MSESIWEPVKAENLVRHRPSGNYYLQAKVGGKKVRKSLKTSSLAQAKIRRDVRLGKLRAAIPRSGESLRTFEDAVGWLELRELNRPELAPASLVQYRDMFRIMRLTLPLGRSLASWKAEEAILWWKSISHRAGSTINKILGFMRVIFREVMKSGQRLDDPMEGIKAKRIKKSAVEKLPDRATFELVLVTMRGAKHGRGHRPADMVEGIAWSGMRANEARNALWEDDKGEWFLIHGGEKGTKNKETRLVPINPRLRALLDRIKPKNAEGLIFRMKSPRRSLDRACDELGIPRMRLHDLRHLFATMAIEAGVDIPTVSKWLGHKDGGALAMRTYGHIRDDHSLASAQKMK